MTLYGFVIGLAVITSLTVICAGVWAAAESCVSAIRSGRGGRR